MCPVCMQAKIWTVKKIVSRQAILQNTFASQAGKGKGKAYYMYFVGKNFDVISWLKRLATRPTLGFSMTLLCLPCHSRQKFSHSFDINLVNKSVGTGRPK